MRKTKKMQPNAPVQYYDRTFEVIKTVEKVKVIRNHTFNKESRTLLRYFLATLARNKIIILVLLVGLIALLGVPIMLVGLSNKNINEAIYEKSLLYISLPSVISLLFIVFGVVVLLVQTKNNNVDLFMCILPMPKKRILFIKKFSIWLATILVIFIEFILSITMILMGADSLKIILIFLAMTASLLVLNWVWITIFSFFALNMKHLLALVTNLVVGFILVGGLAFVITSQDYYPTTGEFNSYKYKKNIVRVFSLSDSGEVAKSGYAIYENPSALKEQKIDAWSPSQAIKFLPLSTISGFAPDMLRWLMRKNIENNKLILLNNKYSINYNEFTISDFKDVVNYDNIMITSIKEKTPFDFKDKESLFKAVLSMIKTNPRINSKLTDGKYWDVLKKELEQRINWNGNLSETEKNMISTIIGIDKTESLLYTIFDKHGILFERYLNGMKEYIAKETTKEFADFVNYLWTNQLTKFNLFSYGSFGDYKTIYKYHPNTSSYNEFKKANKYDIEYIKEILFNIKENNNVLTVQALDDKGVYQDLTNVQNVFSSKVKTKKDIYDYIDKNNTINNLGNIILKANSGMNGNIGKVAFRNNVKNNLILSNKVEINANTKFSINWVYIIVLIMASAFMQNQMNNKVMKGDIK